MSTRSETVPRTREVISLLASRMRQVGIFLALIAIVAFFQIVTGGKLLTAGNVANIIVQNSYILILAIGMAMVTIAGHLGLSVGSVAACVGAMSGVIVVHWGWRWWP